ncbi:hypothetical protein ACIQ9P_31985 [Kitasatospora sp. NPDC094019]|uniref:hypothetical protein n=1 Tax=Kitasatospora sp. NPDC094019 TaxID=3364091 RepID=UPI00382714B8
MAASRSGSVSSGRFAGASTSGLFVVLHTNPAACLLPGGSTSASGTGTLTILT